MVKRGQQRASGATGAEEETRAKSEDLDEPIESEVLREERERRFRTPGFSRMRLNWQGDDREVVRNARDAVDGRILHNFLDAYQIMHKVYDLVREPEVDKATGEVAKDRFGFTIWAQDESGDYREDWSRLTRREKEDLLFAITTRLFEWEQRAGDAWGESMMAKAKWEERHAITYDAPLQGTIHDRNAKGAVGSTEERYLAIFLTWYSRRADALVRNLALLAQRLKDTLEA